MAVLIVDADSTRARRTGDVLRRAGHVAWVTRSSGHALRLLDQGRFTLVLVDVGVAPLSGVRMLEIVRELDPEAHRVLTASPAHLQAAIDAVERGVAHRFMPQPCGPSLLRELAEWACPGQRLRQSA